MKKLLLPIFRPFIHIASTASAELVETTPATGIWRYICVCDIIVHLEQNQ